MSGDRHRILVVAAALVLACVVARLLSLLPGTTLLLVTVVAQSLTVGKLRRVLQIFFPFALFGAAYGWLGLLGPHVVSRGVHVAGPYLLDKELFGLGEGAWRVTLNELFARYHGKVLDVVTGLAYASFLYVVLGAAVFLALADRSAAGARRVRHFGWCFLALNVAGFATYAAFPAAPPWYVSLHGLGPVDPAATPNPAALARVDALFGVPYFATFYAHSQEVFGSMPSMHCAYPLLMWLFVRELGRPWASRAALLFWLVTCFAAVYLQHHYVIDGIAGAGYALLIYGANRWARRSSRIADDVPLGATAPA